MSTTIPIGQIERKTQNRVVKLFQNKLNYRYLGDLNGQDNKNIREDDLTTWLAKRGVSAACYATVQKSKRAWANKRKRCG